MCTHFITVTYLHGVLPTIGFYPPPLWFFTTQSRLLTTLRKKPFENIVEQGKNLLVTSIFTFSHNVLDHLKQFTLPCCTIILTRVLRNIPKSYQKVKPKVSHQGQCRLTLVETFCRSMHLTLYHTIPTFNDPEKETFRKHCGKRRNAGNQHFLLFPQCFLPIKKEFLGFSYIYFVICNCFYFGPCKCFHFGQCKCFHFGPCKCFHFGPYKCFHFANTSFRRTCIAEIKVPYSPNFHPLFESLKNPRYYDWSWKGNQHRGERFNNSLL